MGEQDYADRLYPIYRFATDLILANNWPFRFDVDSGHHETAIQIFEDGTVLKSPKPGFKGISYIREPDLLDFKHRLVIEYDEEAQPNTGYLGAKHNKGHMEGNARDVMREKLLLHIALPPFKMCIVWESDKDWKNTVRTFLENAYKEIKNVK